MNLFSYLVHYLFSSSAQEDDNGHKIKIMLFISLSYHLKHREGKLSLKITDGTQQILKTRLMVKSQMTKLIKLSLFFEPIQEFYCLCNNLYMCVYMCVCINLSWPENKQPALTLRPAHEVPQASLTLFPHLLGCHLPQFGRDRGFGMNPRNY